MAADLILDTHRWNPERDKCPHCHQKPPDEVTSQWLEASLDNGWVAALRVAVQDGRPVVAELRVIPDEGHRDVKWAGCWSAERLGSFAAIPPGGLTARKLRAVRLESIMREQLKPLVEFYATTIRRRMSAVSVSEPIPTLVQGLTPQSVHRPRRTRAAQVSDAELVQVALEYIERCLDPDTAQRPIRALADAHPGWTANYARDRVFAARERGLLTSPGRGRQGGALTTKAEQLLHEDAASGKKHEEHP